MNPASFNISNARHPRGRGFTLIEILLAVAILSLLIGLLVVGISKAFKASSIKAHEQALANLKIAIDQFTQNFNFPPPLVKDDEPIPGTPEDRIPVYMPSVALDGQVLRRQNPPADPYDDRLRYSLYSLPYYISGACEYVPGTWQVPIDGVTGPGFVQPLPDGSFKVPAAFKQAASAASSKSTGKVYEPFFDASKGTLKLVQTQTNRAEYHDRKGNPFRYYRWLPDAANPPTNMGTYNNDGFTGLRAYLNVPLVVGDPEADNRLRDATWAVVWCGSDGLFGDETVDILGERLGRVVDSANEAAARLDAMKDNVVEAGK